MDGCGEIIHGCVCLRFVQHRHNFVFVHHSNLIHANALYCTTPNGDTQVQIWVRRAGPNYQEGLQKMRKCANETDLPIHVYGPETHVTAIVPLALGLAKVDDFPEFGDDDGAHNSKPPAKKSRTNGNPKSGEALKPQKADHEADHKVENFTAMTRCIVFGLQQRAVQGMLDFDFMCKRENPSVAAMISPFSSNHNLKVGDSTSVGMCICVFLFLCLYARRRYTIWFVRIHSRNATTTATIATRTRQSGRYDCAAYH